MPVEDTFRHHLARLVEEQRVPLPQKLELYAYG